MEVPEEVDAYRLLFGKAAAYGVSGITMRPTRQTRAAADSGTQAGAGGTAQERGVAAVGGEELVV